MFQYAAGLCKEIKAELIVVNVINQRDVDAIERFASERVNIDPKKYVEQRRRERSERMETLFNEMPAKTWLSSG